MSPRIESAGRILVVEDEDGSREALAALLDDEGYEVRSARGGDDAILLISDWTPDMIVSDVSMPRGDGFSLVPALRSREDCKDATILLVSARDDVKRRVAGLDIGADDFMGKPVDPEELLARIRSHFRSSARRKLAAKHECTCLPTCSSATDT